jgi:hypothetical protein
VTDLIREEDSAMAHVQTELARDRQRSLLAAAEAQRDGQRAWMHDRMARRAQRAERRQTRQADQAARWRAALEQLESTL